jgi:hypothetical protein
MTAEDLGTKGEGKATCVCPFCDETVDAWAPWCKTCEVEVRFCVSCKEPLPADVAVCPGCGTECGE